MSDGDKWEELKRVAKAADFEWALTEYGLHDEQGVGFREYASAAKPSVVLELLAENEALRALPNCHIGSCGGCFFAAQHIEALHELIAGAAPLGWVAASDMDTASQWEKQAVELMAIWPKPPEET